MADSRMVKVPANMPMSRYQGKLEIPITGEVPFFDKNDPKSKQIQRRLIAKVKLFNLADAADLKEYERVWQMIGDKLALFCKEVGPTWDEKQGAYVVFLRWAELEAKLPEA